MSSGDKYFLFEKLRKTSKIRAVQGAARKHTDKYVTERQRRNATYIRRFTRRRKEGLRYDIRFVRRRDLPTRRSSFRRLQSCLREG